MATSAPAGENIQIHIAENGTTTLATAGKYCEANIDVNVNVPEKATQFTNYYIPENVVIDTVSSFSSANGHAMTTDNECNVIKIHYYHKANEPFVLRMRGINIPRSRFAYVVFNEDETTAVQWGQTYTYSDVSYDEYGDAVITFKNGPIRKDWYTLYLNFQYSGVNSAETVLTGPIITINEPIGNGGYAG